MVDIGCGWDIINLIDYHAVKGRVDRRDLARESAPRLRAYLKESGRKPPQSVNVDYVIIIIRTNEGGTTGESSRPLHKAQATGAFIMGFWAICIHTGMDICKSGRRRAWFGRR